MNLESDKRLNIQLRLDFSSAPTGEARQAGGEDIESLSVVSEPERPANTFNRVSATSRTAVYGPVRTVVWEGRSREAPPYPDQCPLPQAQQPGLAFVRTGSESASRKPSRKQFKEMP